MYETVECQYLQTGDTVYVSLELPRTCPHCNAGYAGKTTSASALNLDSNVIAASHFCPACSEYFFATYYFFHLMNVSNLEEYIQPQILSLQLSVIGYQIFLPSL